MYIKIFTSEGFKVVQVHKLVAEYFLQPQPSPNYVLNHKNGVISDNRDINLRWITRSESGKIGALKTSKVKGIVKIDPVTNEIIDFYKSSRDAARKNFCSYQSILDNCNKKSKKHCTGYIFRWDGDSFYG